MSYLLLITDLSSKSAFSSTIPENHVLYRFFIYFFLSFIELMFVVDIVISISVQNHLLTMTRRVLH